MTHLTSGRNIGSAIVVWELFFGMAVGAFSGSPVALLSRLVLGAVLSGVAFGSVRRALAE